MLYYSLHQNCSKPVELQHLQVRLDFKMNPGQNGGTLKGVVHFKKKSFADNVLTSPHVIQDVHFFSRKEIKVFDENIPGFSPYNGLQWQPNCSRSTRQFQCSFKGL